MLPHSHARGSIGSAFTDVYISISPPFFMIGFSVVIIVALEYL